MTEKLFIVPEDQRPTWLLYPHSFCRLVEQGLVDLTPWHLMEAKKSLLCAQGLAERYPSRELFPFAYRQDNDDVACWSREGGQEVLVIHDFASIGWEVEGRYEDVWAWFRSAIEETIAWD